MSANIDDLEQRRICFKCVGEEYLRQQVRKHGESAKCSYCGQIRRAITIEAMAEQIEAAFERHYARTSNEPDLLQWVMTKDKESDYEWEREGEPVIWAIANAALVNEEVATDIQNILEDKFGHFDSAAMGLETEFDADSYYEEKDINDGLWQSEWSEFERNLKTEARFFSRSAARLLASVFNGIERLQTREGRPVIVNAGPSTEWPAVYRARAFQSNVRLQEALARPDRYLGSPSVTAAAAGRMNARGISVFYGANDPVVALAEVRPPVGCQVVVARFEIIRPLRLLDLTALSKVTIKGSIFDPDYQTQLEHAAFLRNLGERIVRPVMPDDEPFEYLATQAVADFLATENDNPVDGIIFPSVQAAGNALNVVLFHEAAQVEEIELPPGTEIETSLGEWTGTAGR
jgi:RES domain